MSLTWYAIEESLEQLAELREAAEREGDSEALKVIDQQFAEYLTKQSEKINSYCGLIRRREDDAQLIQEEIIRLTDLRKAAESDVRRLKMNAQVVMERFGVKELKSPTNRLRIQGNGGVRPLDVDGDPGDLYKDVTLKVSVNRWNEILSTYPGAWAGVAIVGRAPNSERIRRALERGEEVPGARLLERGSHLVVE